MQPRTLTHQARKPPPTGRRRPAAASAGGIYFASLPANMLGSFVIGVFAASSTLGLRSDKPMAVLPAGHPWQRNFALQIGVRTAFCGCLTTFSAWVVELVGDAILYSSWVSAAGGLVVGLQAALVSYVAGTHVALYVDRWVLAAGEDVVAEAAQYRRAEVERYRKGAAGALEELTPEQEELQREEGDLPRVLVAAAGGADGASRAGAAPPEAERHVTRTDAAAAAALALVTAGLACGLALETRHAWLRELWAAGLVAPSGCALRWYLSRFNYRLPRSWAWLPAGTLAANMSGTALAFGLRAALERGAPGAWGALLLRAAVGGFCGALTTVSTLVTEVRRLVAWAHGGLGALHLIKKTLAQGCGKVVVVSAAVGGQLVAVRFGW
jgi:fluoride ion exporter CrcB/FEX